MVLHTYRIVYSRRRQLGEVETSWTWSDRGNAFVTAWRPVSAFTAADALTQFDIEQRHRTDETDIRIERVEPQPDPSPRQHDG